MECSTYLRRQTPDGGMVVTCRRDGPDQWQALFLQWAPSRDQRLIARAPESSGLELLNSDRRCDRGLAIHLGILQENVVSPEKMCPP